MLLEKFSLEIVVMTNEECCLCLLCDVVLHWVGRDVSWDARLRQQWYIKLVGRGVCPSVGQGDPHILWSSAMAAIHDSYK